ncbi:hypothetical protein C1646_767158 [Rhizophagus diaphanus]|nr:hypothetical protein C1646_767158 [Rhizophagus diaphanus] [Rhizophagus sp. MUCL 43196]
MTANAFEVDIEKDKSISHLKKVIKTEKQNDFADTLLEELIHVLVSPPETTTSDEVLKLREEVASLKEKFSNSVHMECKHRPGDSRRPQKFDTCNEAQNASTQKMMGQCSTW